MRHTTYIVWMVGLLLGVACETPDQNDSAEPRSEEERTREESSRRHGGSGAGDGAFEFESMTAAPEGGREALLHAIPADPRALLWVFHGRGDSRELCRREHLQRAMRAFYRAGFAIVCPQSLDRAGEAWEGGTPSREGADIQNVRRVRTRLREDDLVPADLPEFGWGLSNGGGFAGRWAYHELSRGADVRGIQCMISQCQVGTLAGEKFGLRIHWAATENDPFFPIDRIRATHRDYGGAKSLVVAEPAPLTPTKLQSLADLSTSDARRAYDTLREADLLDADDHPTCDPKASSTCRDRLAETAASADLSDATRAIRYAYENCRATHTEFHHTCHGAPNTATALDAFRSQLP